MMQSPRTLFEPSRDKPSKRGEPSKYPLEGIVFLWNNIYMPAEVVVTAEFVFWWDGLTEAEQASVSAVVKLLELFGATLGFPHSSAIAGSKKLRELRVQHCGEPYRVLYAFDPARKAILLMGGNKTGKDRWYEQNIRLAEGILDEYLRETGQK
jgi:hypothetical protein